MTLSIFYKNRACPAKLRSGGFTLTEMMVVMGISTVLMTTLVIQQSQWTDQLNLNTEAYRLTSDIRKAQFYSLSVKEDVVGSGDFDVGYGVYFDQTNMNQYVFFADRNKDQQYNPGEGIVELLNKGVTIKKVCGVNNLCFPGNGSLAQVHVSFFRPDTNAILNLLNFGGGPSAAQPPVIITLQSPKNKEVSIRIEANGQVSIIQ